MKDNLPKVFKNILEKQIENNEKVHMTKAEINNREKITATEEINQRISQNNKQKVLNIVEKKLSKLINDKKHYTYRIPVEIELQDKTITTKIIGKTKNTILTIDNEKIEIEKIKNITIIEK